MALNPAVLSLYKSTGEETEARGLDPTRQTRIRNSGRAVWTPAARLQASQGYGRASDPERVAGMQGCVTHYEGFPVTAW